MTNQTIEQAVEEIVSTVETVEFLHGVPVNLPSQYKADLRGVARKALQAQRDAGAEEEREKWIKAVGEKIDKTTRELMLSAFQEGVAVTRAQYNEAIKSITPPTK